VLALHRWAREHLLEDIDFAVLAGADVGHHEACQQWINLHLPYLPTASFKPGAQHGCDVRHRGRILGCNVQVLAQPINQAMRLDCVAAGKDERIR
jgi:hypothetical protein